MHYQQNQHYQQLQYQHYLESQKHHQTHQMMIRTCPVHGEGNQYKQTLEMMQSQAHAYAFSCFLYFQHMAKTAKTPEEKAYYLHQQGVAGCMVHGPHGISPVGIPQPPALGHYGIQPKYGYYSYMGPKMEDASKCKKGLGEMLKPDP